jgi:hypothetical protein
MRVSVRRVTTYDKETVLELGLRGFGFGYGLRLVDAVLEE